MWVYNDHYGSWRGTMKGWLYVQGCWSWGCAITWHVCHILERRDDERKYYWFAYLWRWTYELGWRAAPFLSIPANHAFVEEWMVHEEAEDADWRHLEARSMRHV